MYLFPEIREFLKNKKFKMFYNEIQNLIIKKNKKFNNYRKKLQLSDSLLGTGLLIIYIFLFKSNELKKISNDFKNIFFKYFEENYLNKKKQIKENLKKFKKSVNGYNIFLALLLVIIIIYIFYFFFVFLIFFTFLPFLVFFKFFFLVFLPPKPVFP